MTDASHRFSAPAVLPDAASAAVVFTYSHPGQSALRRRLIRSVEALSGRRGFERLYDRWRRGARDPAETIFTAGVRALGLSPRWLAGGPGGIPETGGLLVVANHPYGIADGLMLGHLVSQVRPDVKLMVHSLLCRPPEAREALLPVDFGGDARARRVSAETRKAAVDWLDQGHVLVIFPAGGVATTPRPWARQAADFAWHPFIARLAQRPGVRVLPVWLGGQNSRLFQIVSHYSYPLRVALIFRETRRLMGRAMAVAVGAPIDCSTMAREDIPGRLRAACFGLAGQDGRREFSFPKRIRW